MVFLLEHLRDLIDDGIRKKDLLDSATCIGTFTFQIRGGAVLIGLVMSPLSRPTLSGVTGIFGMACSNSCLNSASLAVLFNLASVISQSYAVVASAYVE